MTYAAGSSIAAADLTTLIGTMQAVGSSNLPSWSNKHTGLNIFGDTIQRINGGVTYGWSSAKLNKSIQVGKFYWEVTIESAANSSTNNRIMIGIGNSSTPINNFIGADSSGIGFYNNGGGTNTQTYYLGGSTHLYGSGTFGAGDVIGVLYDSTTGSISFYKNNVNQGAITIPMSAPYFPMVSLYDNSNRVFVNFGQSPFVYPIPSGAGLIFSAANQLGSIFGIGYGDWGYQQNVPSLTIPTAGADIASSNWNNLSVAIKKCADHQGIASTLNPPAAQLVTGSKIIAYTAPLNTAYSFSKMIGSLSKTRHNAAAGAMSVYLPTTYGLRLTYSGASWGSGVTNGLRCVARYSFTNEEEARKFFNTGGELRISIAHPNTSTVQNSNWNALCAAVGTIKIGANSTVVTGSVGSSMGIGYYQCTTSIQTVFDGTNIGTGAYTANDLIVSIASMNAPGTNGGRGYQLNVTVQLNDQHTNAFSDTVNNGTYADFGYYAATTYLTSPVPTVTQITAWTTISV